MDTSIYANAMVNGVPLSLVVFGLTWLWGKKLAGMAQLASALVTGLVLGGGYFVYATPPPAEPGWYPLYGYWFAAGIYGLGLGVAAILEYEGIKAAVEKGTKLLVDRQQVG